MWAPRLGSRTSVNGATDNIPTENTYALRRLKNQRSALLLSLMRSPWPMPTGVNAIISKVGRCLRLLFSAPGRSANGEPRCAERAVACLALGRCLASDTFSDPATAARPR